MQRFNKYNVLLDEHEAIDIVESRFTHCWHTSTHANQAEVCNLETTASHSLKVEMTSNDMETDDETTQKMDIHSEASSDIEIESESEHTADESLTFKPSSTSDANLATSKPQGSGSSHSSILPLARIKKIMKADPELNKCTPDSVLATAISTELFLEWLATTAAEIARTDNRKTIKYDDLAQIVAKDERASFLNGK